MNESTPHGSTEKQLAGAVERARELAMKAALELGLRLDSCAPIWAGDVADIIERHVAGALAAVRLEALEQAAGICDFAANGTIEQMCVDGRSETWKILAEQSVEQYRSVARNIRRLAGERAVEGK